MFAIDESFPTVAVVGFSQPALFIAERVLRECTTDEVRAMVMHECAHVTQRDNLKRFLMRACPDAAAARQRARARLDAARRKKRPTPRRRRRRSRLRARTRAGADSRRPPRAAASSTLELASAFYLGGSIEARVRHLLEPAQRLPDPSRPLGCVMALTMIGALAGIVVLSAPALHELMEAAVRALP